MTDQNGATSTPVNRKPGDTNKERFTIAINILLWAFVVLSVIIVVALLMIGLPVIIHYDAANATTAYQSIKDLFGIVLPLLGTWVGTILAFYFSQTNFEAATQSTIDLHQQFKSSEEKLKSIKITDKMIPMDQVSAKLTIESGKSEKDYLLTDLITKLENGDKTPRQRLQILDEQEYIKYIVHRSLIDKFRSEKIGDPNVAKFTLQDMVDNAKYKAVLMAFGILPPTANLADAKHLIDNNTDCSDVFVTEDGKQTAKVQGWVTNVDIEKIAQL
jgi:hypothetical protein